MAVGYKLNVSANWIADFYFVGIESTLIRFQLRSVVFKNYVYENIVNIVKKYAEK